MRLLWLNALFGSILTGCGLDPTYLLPPPPPLPSIVLASPEQLAKQQALSGSYMVAFRSQNTSKMLQFADYGAEYRAHYAFMGNHLRLNRHIKDINFITAVDLSDPAKTFVDPEINPPRTLQLAWQGHQADPLVGSLARVDFVSAEAAAPVLQDWHAKGLIWFAEPNYMSQPTNSGLSLGEWGNFKTQYDELDTPWHNDIDLTDAYASLDEQVPVLDGSPPIIAIMDSGVDDNHPHLAPNMFTNADPGKTFCGTDDIHGCNTTAVIKGQLGNGTSTPFLAEGPDDTCPDSPNGGCLSNCCHGTHVAGIAAAIPNDKGYGGVCPICQIMALRVVGKNPTTVTGQESGTILDSSIAAAFKYASQFRRSDAPVRVINASFGKFQRSRSVGVLVRAITDTPNNKGILVVGAAGNEDTMRIQYPAGYSDAIAVANIVVGENEAKAPSSNFGRWVDISAPGQSIVSAIPDPGDNTEEKVGTSMASPVVAGVAGLLAVINEEMSISEMRRRILNGADPTLYENDVNAFYIPEIPGEGNVPLLGSGLINAANSVKGDETQGRPSVLALDRVEPGCAVIKSMGRRASMFWLLLPGIFVGLLQLQRLFRKHQFK